MPQPKTARLRRKAAASRAEEYARAAEPRPSTTCFWCNSPYSAHLDNPKPPYARVPCEMRTALFLSRAEGLRRETGGERKSRLEGRLGAMMPIRLDPPPRPERKREAPAKVAEPRRSVRPSAETKEKIRRSVAAWWARKNEEG